MRDNQAIKPDKVFFNLPSLVKKDKVAKKKGATDEERALALLADTDGWGFLKKVIDRAIKDLDQINEQAIARGASREEIGENAIVISLAKGVIKQIVDKVQDAKEAFNEPGQKG